MKGTTQTTNGATFPLRRGRERFFQDRERQDVATEAYRDVFTAFLKEPLSTTAQRGTALLSSTGART